MKLYFKLLGRLGNHFYIISALYYVIRKYNIKSYLLYNSNTFYTNHFNVINNIDNISYKNQYESGIHKDHFDLDLFINENNNDDIICFNNSYFQSNKYFLSYKNELRSIFSYYTDKTQELIKMINNYNINNICFISVRRGDYIYYKFYVLSKNYYIDMYNKYFSGNVIFMSSDDINWCKNNLKISDFNDCPNIIYIENMNASEIYTISTLFKHYICANSTFSSMCELSSYNNDKISIGVNKLSSIYKRKTLFSNNAIIIDVESDEYKKYLE